MAQISVKLKLPEADLKALLANDHEFERYIHARAHEDQGPDAGGARRQARRGTSTGICPELRAGDGSASPATGNTTSITTADVSVAAAAIGSSPAPAQRKDEGG